MLDFNIEFFTLCPKVSEKSYYPNFFKKSVKFVSLPFA